MKMLSRIQQSALVATVALAVLSTPLATGAPSPTGPRTTDFSYGLSKLSALNGAVVETNFDHSDESSTSAVSLDACSSRVSGGIAGYRWTFGNGDSPISTTNCKWSWSRPLSHTLTSVAVTLTVLPRNPLLRPASVSKQVKFRDFVIASLGDSAASGEGAPENLGQRNAFIASAECDRSGWAASAQAALQMQQQLADTTVHLWHLACSGAAITNADSGIFRVIGDNPSQQGGVISAGINDLHWATIAPNCIITETVGAIALGQSVLPACLAVVAPVVASAESTLPAHYDALAAALTPALVPAGSVYLTEYFDPMDSLSVQPPICTGEPEASPIARSWGVDQVEKPLLTIMKAAALRHGWNYIGGIQQAFQGHGVCQNSSNRWVNSFLDSQNGQQNENGTWHANRGGQMAIATIIFNAISSNPAAANANSGKSYPDPDSRPLGPNQHRQ
jgi:hypothetical protein